MKFSICEVLFVLWMGSCGAYVLGTFKTCDFLTEKTPTDQEIEHTTGIKPPCPTSVLYNRELGDCK